MVGNQTILPLKLKNFWFNQLFWTTVFQRFFKSSESSFQLGLGYDSYLWLQIRRIIRAPRLLKSYLWLYVNRSIKGIILRFIWPPFGIILKLALLQYIRSGCTEKWWHARFEYGMMMESKTLILNYMKYVLCIRKVGAEVPVPARASRKRLKHI